MGITPQFSPSLLRFVGEEIPRIFRHEIQRALSYLGEQCVRRIRDRTAEESWEDRTGNLRSSIGYAVYEEGRLEIESAFEQVAGGSAGTAEGRRVVAELASEYADTFALVILAGMEYAPYVEAMRKKDVLASTELWARSEIHEYIDKGAARALRQIEKRMRSLGA